jgi:hypothetical protein
LPEPGGPTTACPKPMPYAAERRYVCGESVSDARRAFPQCMYVCLSQACWFRVGRWFGGADRPAETRGSLFIGNTMASHIQKNLSHIPLRHPLIRSKGWGKGRKSSTERESPFVQRITCASCCQFSEERQSHIRQHIRSRQMNGSGLGGKTTYRLAESFVLSPTER